MKKQTLAPKSQIFSGIRNTKFIVKNTVPLLNLNVSPEEENATTPASPMEVLTDDLSEGRYRCAKTNVVPLQQFTFDVEKSQQGVMGRQASEPFSDRIAEEEITLTNTNKLHISSNED